MNHFVAIVTIVLALDGPSKQQQVAQEFVQALVTRDFKSATALYDATMMQVMPERKLESTWDAVLAQVGEYQKEVSIRQERLASYEIVFVRTAFERAKLDIKVVLDPSNRVAGLFFLPPQDAKAAVIPDYLKRQSFIEHEVSFGDVGWELPGTLTLPHNASSVPGVVLVHGSGPNDRDETLGPNKPFRDLAHGLAQQGIAVLRYEKRTKQHGNKMAAVLEQLTIKEETVDDALAAVRLLRAAPEVDTDRVFVLGHSLGGMMAPRIAEQDPGIRGYVVMGGNARPLTDLIIEQTTYLYKLDGALSADENAEIERLRQQIEGLNTSTANQASDRSTWLMNVPPKYWHDLLSYSPTETARSVNRPLLVLQGERDYQVTMDDYRGWKQALSGRDDATFISYPELNHLFMSGSGPSTPAEYMQPGHIPERVVQDVASWIHSQQR